MTMAAKFFNKIFLLLISAVIKAQENNSLIYILEWTGADKEPFSYLDFGQDAFIQRKCEYQNCYLTQDRNFLSDVTQYDALVFNVILMNAGIENDLPKNRSVEQEYVLVGLEPAGYYTVPDRYNGFFNVTWTYKLSSDVPYPYFHVKNATTGETIGPRKEMHWMKFEDMPLTRSEITAKFKNKTKAGVWIVSNCYAEERLRFVHALNKELEKYSKTIDIFGNCGNHNWYCPRWVSDESCYQRVEDEYYFYLAFENFCCEDYVSEKVLHALQHYAVPIVYGGANYSRFLPDGSYLNGAKLGIADLAKEINDIINDPNRYEDFFRWHGYYSFVSTEVNRYKEAVCGLCSLLNNQTRRQQPTYYRNISKWWNEYSKGYPSIEPEPKDPAPGVVGFLDNLYTYFFDN